MVWNASPKIPAVEVPITHICFNQHYIFKGTNKDKSAKFKELSEKRFDSNGLGDLEQAAEIIDSIIDQAEDEVSFIYFIFL